MPVQKLKPSFNLEQDRIEMLKQLIPEAVSDGKINWDVLKEALGEHLEDEGSDVEHFGLSWAGKREARRLASIPSKGTLVPVLGEGIDEDTTGNIFIEGDNLEVLKLLQKSYVGKVKLIYIDPPYNTGNDFIYKDDYSEPTADYLRKTEQIDESGKLLTTNPKTSGRFHSNWLSMMYPRLRLAKNLLRDDGVIFVSIDDNEVHNLRQLMNEIFGEENFIDCLIWKKRYGGGGKEKHLVSLHEYILFYSKSKDCLEEISVPLTEESIERYYKLKDDNFEFRGAYRTHPLEAPKSVGARPNLVYGIPDPTGSEIYPQRQWLWSRERTMEAIKNNEIEFVKSKNGLSVHTKQYLRDKNGEIRTTKAFSIIDDVFTQDGTNEIVNLFGDAHIFPFPKPTQFISKLLQIAMDKDDLVVDIFGGSCSTACSVINLNKEDGGNRRFIMVQMPEETKNDQYPTIAEIGKERIRRVIKKIKDEQAEKLDLAESQDLGFKVYKLDRSNLKIWKDYDGEDIQAVEQLLIDFQNPLGESLSEEKVVTELQLLEGFPLDSKIDQSDTFTQNKVLCVTSEHIEHRLFICLDNKLDIATVQDVQLLEDEDIFVCLDNALTDQEKMMLADGCNVKTI